MKQQSTTSGDGDAPDDEDDEVTAKLREAVKAAAIQYGLQLRDSLLIGGRASTSASLLALWSAMSCLQ